MKKIISILLIFVAITAFSGLATATPVSATKITDKGSKTIYRSGGVTDHFNWFLVYYSTTHSKFYVQQKHYLNGIYKYKFLYTTDFKKLSKTSLRLTVNAYVNGKIVYHRVGYVKTSKSAYQYFKSRKSALISTIVE
jgi:hypothetical protein